MMLNSTFKKKENTKPNTPKLINITHLIAANINTGQYPNSRIHLSKCCVGDPLWISY